MKSPAEEQRAIKYEHHDWHPDELTEWDLGVIRGMAINNFIKSSKNDNVRVTIDAFLTYLTSKGYRIVKKETK